MKREDRTGKAVGTLNGVSGMGSVISAHNVCHILCLGVVAVLSLFGILVSSDSLMFLEDYNLLFWSMGLVFLAISLYLWVNRPYCISKKLILANSGILVIGTPFSFVGNYEVFFWVAGGLIVSLSIAWYVDDKLGVKDGKKKNSKKR